MKELLEQIRQKAKQELAAAEDSKGLEELRVRYLGKKGELTAILKQMGALSAEERPVIGQLANQIRAEIETELKEADAHVKQHMLRSYKILDKGEPPAYIIGYVAMKMLQLKLGKFKLLR